MIRARIRELEVIGSQDVDQWLLNFRDAMKKAHNLSLPDVTDNQDVWMFLAAVEPLQPVWAEIQRTRVQSQLSTTDAKVPTVYELLTDFSTSQRLKRAREKVVPTAFASLKG